MSLDISCGEKGEVIIRLDDLQAARALLTTILQYKFEGHEAPSLRAHSSPVMNELAIALWGLVEKDAAARRRFVGAEDTGMFDVLEPMLLQVVKSNLDSLDWTSRRTVEDRRNLIRQLASPYDLDRALVDKLLARLDDYGRSLIMPSN